MKMNEHEIALTREWVKRWAKVGPVIEKLSIEHDKKATLAEVLPQFNEALRDALEKYPPEPYSGLIEQQAVFRRARR